MTNTHTHLIKKPKCSHHVSSKCQWPSIRTVSYEKCPQGIASHAMKTEIRYLTATSCDIFRFLQLGAHTMSNVMPAIYLSHRLLDCSE